MRTPCMAYPELWTSDEADERENAAHACGTCPIKDACLAGAQDRMEEWHVWGGVDFTPGSQRKTPRRPCNVCGVLMPRTKGRQRTSCEGCIETKPCESCGHNFPRTYQSAKQWGEAKFCGHQCSRAAQIEADKVAAA